MTTERSREQVIETPCEDGDEERLPGWWSDAITEFNEYNLPSYRPPRFVDGVITPPVIERLQSEYEAEIRFMGISVEYRDTWGVYVDGERILNVNRERKSAGYTQYQITSGEFEQAVRDHFATAGVKTE